MSDSTKHRYVLDAGVFIQAHRYHYAMDFCPSYWEGLLHFHEQGRVISITRMRDELLKGKKTRSKAEREAGVVKPDDALVAWVKSHAPKALFVSDDHAAVTDAFRELVNIVDTDRVDFTPDAKQDFSDGNDGWLIAYAKALGLTVVTHEGSEPTRRNRVKIPDLCRKVGVRSLTPFEMLRELGMRFSSFDVTAPAVPVASVDPIDEDDDEDSVEG